jgi:hypothetical protein
VLTSEGEQYRAEEVQKPGRLLDSVSDCVHASADVTVGPDVLGTRVCMLIALYEP